eukprot:1798917-Prymnesium_polylepis.1
MAVRAPELEWRTLAPPKRATHRSHTRPCAPLWTVGAKTALPRLAEYALIFTRDASGLRTIGLLSSSFSKVPENPGCTVPSPACAGSARSAGSAGSASGQHCVSVSAPNMAVDRRRPAASAAVHVGGARGHGARREERAGAAQAAPARGLAEAAAAGVRGAA